VDGNRRWAKARGLPTLEGHRRGYGNINKIADALFSLGVSYVTAYIFSTENWNRDKNEVSYLMDLAYERITKDLKILDEKNIRLCVLGRRDRVSKKLLKVIDNAVDQTKDNDGGTLSFCFNYGGQQEIVDAVNNLDPAKIGLITTTDIDNHLYAPDIPPIDILVRTSGEFRISNFMLWRISYSELMFMSKHFPALNKKDAQIIVQEYASRQRRFGK